MLCCAVEDEDIQKEDFCRAGRDDNTTKHCGIEASNGRQIRDNDADHDHGRCNDQREGNFILFTRRLSSIFPMFVAIANTLGAIDKMAQIRYSLKVPGFDVQQDKIDIYVYNLINNCTL